MADIKLCDHCDLSTQGSLFFGIEVGLGCVRQAELLPSFQAASAAPPRPGHSGIPETGKLPRLPSLAPDIPVLRIGDEASRRNRKLQVRNSAYWTGGYPFNQV